MQETPEEALLIVDDEEINRTILANIFAPQYRILQAKDGMEGLAAIQEHGTCLSRAAGRGYAAHGRHSGAAGDEAAGADPVCPVFLITADSAGSVMREAYDLGVMDVILKPVVPYLVRRRVNSVVELFQARRKLGAEVERQRDQLLLQASGWPR